MVDNSGQSDIIAFNMSLPIDARPGIPGASPQSDQVEQPRTYEQVYTNLGSYFGQKLGISESQTPRETRDTIIDPMELLVGEESVDETLLSTVDLIEGTLDKAVISKFRVPYGVYVRLSDGVQGRVIRIGLALEPKSEDQPEEDYGIELNLAQTDGTVGVFETHIHDDGTEEKVRTERAQLSPDQLGNIAQILGEHFPPRESGTLSESEKTAAKAESTIALAQSEFKVRNLDPMGTNLRDPKSDRLWYLALGPKWRDRNGVLVLSLYESALYMVYGTGKQAEEFYLGFKKTRSGIPVVNTEHKIGWSPVEGETSLQAAELAEVRLKSILGTSDDPTAQKEPSAEEVLESPSTNTAWFR